MAAVGHRDRGSLRELARKREPDHDMARRAGACLVDLPWLGLRSQILIEATSTVPPAEYCLYEIEAPPPAALAGSNGAIGHTSKKSSSTWFSSKVSLVATPTL